MTPPTEAAGDRQLAILGSPITHALSPVLHRAAYAALRLNWSYGAIDCTPAVSLPFCSRWTTAGRGCR
ncbi:hypothetical protein [Streptomyces sp. NPDC046942]|uniref:hypothetical protein n=1 Tax=Streptomyces sp. NPDC046942 TaxID=3155137 RepID=UPI00340CF4C8